MYESFFQLAARPFDLTPNPGFLFLSKLHQRALNYLSYSLREHTGFMLLTGEVGTGKTTLLREIENKHLAEFSIAKIYNTKVDSLQLLRMICDDYGIAQYEADKPDLLQALYAHFIECFAMRRPCVLIIDEAQNLTPELLEEIRLLSNVETDTHKLLRIILVGQPELNALLARPELRQLRQRIQISCHLQPLQAAELESYVLRRLEMAGNRNAARFEPGLFQAAFQYTRGVPRLINILFDFLFLDAYASDTRSIGPAAVHAVAQDLSFEAQYWNTPPGTAATAPTAPHSSAAPDAEASLPAPASPHQEQDSQTPPLQQQALGNALARLTTRLERLEHLQQETASAQAALLPPPAPAMQEEQWNARHQELQQQVRALQHSVDLLQQELHFFRSTLFPDQSPRPSGRPGFWRRLLWGKS
ncbi:XrtA/PEP-CTERM system-associated ATPase [Megalodesulfovibrio paquesii]